MQLKKMILWPMTQVQSPKFFSFFFFSNLAKSLLIKLPNHPDNYNLQSVIRYYSSFTISDYFCLINTSVEKVLKIMTIIESSKAAGVDELSGRFLKDENPFLHSAISQSHREYSQVLVKLRIWNLFLKRERKLILLTTDQSHCFYQFRRSLKG